MATTLKSKSRASGRKSKAGKPTPSSRAARDRKPVARSVAKTTHKKTAPKRAKSPSPKRKAAPAVLVKKTAQVLTAPPRPLGPSPYQKALDFLATYTDYERMRVVRYNTTTFNLDRMRTLLKHLGNPHLKIKTAHVAGTKGKGSTCTMLAALCQGTGLKTGLYTSPHLIDIRERISINGTQISEDDLVAYVKRVEPILKKMANDRPSFFEIFTAMAFSYFADHNVDVAVIETGLGGRLDSTNVIQPEVSAITNISKDHMAVLGNTLTKIAEEKAGIFKKDIPAITCPQETAVMNVLKRKAADAKTTLEVVGTEIEFSYRFEVARPLGPHMRVSLSTPRSHFEHVVVPVMGEHQAVNCGIALAMLDKLKERGLPIEDNKALEGLAKLQLHGRLEMVSNDPQVIIDGAHNAHSVGAVFRAVGQYIPYDSMVVIFGCNCDKDIDGMLERLSLGADKVIFTRSCNNPKAADPHELVNIYTERYGKMAQLAHSLTEAVEIAERAISREDVIVITGSFYLVGEAKEHFAKRKAAVAV